MVWVSAKLHLSTYKEKIAVFYGQFQKSFYNFVGLHKIWEWELVFFVLS